MAVDMFLKLPGIDGESQDEKHKDWIQLLSFSMGTALPAEQKVRTPATNLSDITFVKQVDKSSPKLMSVAQGGQRFPSAFLELQQRETQQVFLKFHLQDVVISSYQVGGNVGDNQPTDGFGLLAHKVEMAVRPKGDGQIG